MPIDFPPYLYNGNISNIGTDIITHPRKLLWYELSVQFVICIEGHFPPKCLSTEDPLKCQ